MTILSTYINYDFKYIVPSNLAWMTTRTRYVEHGVFLEILEWPQHLRIGGVPMVGIHAPNIFSMALYDQFKAPIQVAWVFVKFCIF